MKRRKTLRTIGAYNSRMGSSKTGARIAIAVGAAAGILAPFVVASLGAGSPSSISDFLLLLGLLVMVGVVTAAVVVLIAQAFVSRGKTTREGRVGP